MVPGPEQRHSFTTRRWKVSSRTTRAFLCESMRMVLKLKSRDADAGQSQKAPGVLSWARAPAAHRRATTSQRLPTGSMGTGGKLGAGAAALRAEPPTRTNSQTTMVPESQHNCEMPPTRRRPRWGSPLPRAPRLVAVPRPVLCVYRPRQGEGTGVLVRLFMRAESTRSDTKPMSEGRCQHIFGAAVAPSGCAQPEPPGLGDNRGARDLKLAAERTNKGPF